MGLAEKHPTDEGKYQATFNDYGHGGGNGKSRNAVYKHHKKWKETTDFVESQPPNDPIETEETGDFVESEPLIEEIPVTSDNNSGWSEVDWDEENQSEDEIQSHTIPRRVAEMSQGKQTELTKAATGQMLRFGFMALDRAVSHWGRGVMENPDWAIERSSGDYDAMELSTLNVMEHYGIILNVSPLVVWGATMGSAYAPPLVHVHKNKSATRKRGFLRRIFRRFRRRSAAQAVQVGEVDGNNIVES